MYKNEKKEPCIIYWLSANKPFLNLLKYREKSTTKQLVLDKIWPRLIDFLSEKTEAQLTLPSKLFEAFSNSVIKKSFSNNH